MIRSRHTIKVQAVFSLHNMLTGRGAEAGAVRFSLPEGGKITVKEGGYYVLTGCRDQEIDVVIESPIYEKAAIHIDISESQLEIHKVWLSPNNSYPGSGKYAKVRGEAAGDMEVWAVPLSQEQSVRFLKDYNAQKDGTIFPVYYVGGAYMEGRRAAAVTEGKKGKTVEFTVIEKIDEKNGTCCIDKAFSKNLKKADTSIYPAFRGRTDREGNYRILLPNDMEQAELCLICYEINGKMEIQEAEITKKG